MAKCFWWLVLQVSGFPTLKFVTSDGEVIDYEVCDGPRTSHCQHPCGAGPAIVIGVSGTLAVSASRRVCRGISAVSAILKGTGNLYRRGGNAG